VSTTIAAGWLCDYDAAAPSDVHVYAGGSAGVGKFVGGTTANANRPDLVTAGWPQLWCNCPSAGSCIRGFNIAMSDMRALLISGGFSGTVSFYFHLIKFVTASVNPHDWPLTARARSR
jgi:hypothetical protein